MKAFEWVCKLFSFPFFIAGLVIILPWIEFMFWLDDERDMMGRTWRYVKQYFLDIKEGASDYWHDNIPMKD